MRIVHSYIETDKGRVAYRTNHSAEENCLFFVHGLGGDSKLFHNQLRFFSSRYKVIAIDLPGHGQSDFKGLPDVTDFLESIKVVLESEQVKSCILFGHSMGGGLCIDLFSSVAGIIDAMVLISTGAVLPVASELFDMLERDMDYFIDYFVNATFSQNAGLLASFAKNGVGEREKDILRNDLNLCKKMDFSHLLSGISVPVLIIANRGDRVVPLHITSFLHEKIAGSQMRVLEYEGHIPHFDHKKDFNSAVDLFIKEIFN